MAAEHGTRTRFNQGCAEGPGGTACEACKKANRDYFKKRNLEKNGTPAPAGGKVKAPSAPGPMELVTINMLAELPNATRYPELAAAALMLSKDLDSELGMAQRSALLKQYREIFAELRKGTEKNSKLASVRQMTRPKAAK